MKNEKKKENNCIEKVKILLKKWRVPIITVIAVVIAMVIAIIAVPFIIDIAYMQGLKLTEPNTTFSASDLLAFYGSILAFMGTVVLGVLALWQNRKANTLANHACELNIIGKIIENENEKLNSEAKIFDTFYESIKITNIMTEANSISKLKANKTLDEYRYTSFKEYLEEQEHKVRLNYIAVAELLDKAAFNQQIKNLCHNALNNSCTLLEMFIKMETIEDFKISVEVVTNNSNFWKNEQELAGEIDKYKTDCQQNIDTALYNDLTLSEIKDLFKVKQ